MLVDKKMTSTVFVKDKPMNATHDDDSQMTRTRRLFRKAIFAYKAREKRWNELFQMIGRHARSRQLIPGDISAMIREARRK